MAGCASFQDETPTENYEPFLLSSLCDVQCDMSLISDDDGDGIVGLYDPCLGDSDADFPGEAQPDNTGDGLLDGDDPSFVVGPGCFYKYRCPSYEPGRNLTACTYDGHKLHDCVQGRYALCGHDGIGVACLAGRHQCGTEAD
jgi:hypothetical protein